MKAVSAFAFLVTMLAACSETHGAPTPSTTVATTAPGAPTPSTTVATTAPPTSTATTSPAGATFASVCGTIANFVADSATDGSFILNSPGREPLKITIPAGRLGGGNASGYVCVGVLAGVPSPLFDGFATPGRGFVNSGTLPATTASPEPTGFLLPQACAFVASPIVGADQTEWMVDCGTANNNARGTLGAALMQQGWTVCGSALATAQWRKAGVMLSVAESSLRPGDYPRLIQPARVIAPCT